MGYEVHITRKAEWFGEAGPVVSLEEWLDYVGRDHEMRAERFAQAAIPNGDTIRLDDPGIAVWAAYSGHGVDGNMVWFVHFKHRVSVKNPDPEILRKMYRVASYLGAKVQGDEGEEYGPEGETWAVIGTAHHKQAWWRSWR